MTYPNLLDHFLTYVKVNTRSELEPCQPTIRL
ncbi:peptidase T [Streptococcus pneumoniae]|nr:peptidase T [Streptococcus pneumoniae]